MWQRFRKAVFGYHAGGLRAVVGSHEAIAREARPVARHVYTHRAVDGLRRRCLGVHVDHISLEVLLRGRPCIAVAAERFILHDRVSLTATHPRIGGHGALDANADGLTRTIQSLVSSNVEREYRCDLYRGRRFSTSSSGRCYGRRLVGNGIVAPSAAHHGHCGHCQT